MPKELSQQCVSTMHTALALQKKGGLENRAAWVEALKHFEGRAAMRKKYPINALKEAGCLEIIYYHLASHVKMIRMIHQVSNRSGRVHQVVSVYNAWTTSSSGCEQMFAQLKRITRRACEFQG